MKPFVLVIVDDNAVSDATVVGDSQVEVIVVDFDTLDSNYDAQDLIDQIVAKHEGESATEPAVRTLLDRLEAYIEDNTYDDEDEDEEMDMEDDEGEDEDEEDEYEDDEDEGQPVDDQGDPEVEDIARSL